MAAYREDSAPGDQPATLTEANRELKAALVALEVQYREAEAARCESRAVLDAAGEAMVLVSQDRRILMANRSFAELFGRAPADFIGRNLSEFQEAVSRAEDALRQARTEQPDLVTLNVQEPDGDGYATLEWLKGESATRHIPVVVLSVMEDSGRALQLGAADYLVKPVSEKHLVERVSRLVTK